MNVEEILLIFNNAKGYFPTAALNAALEQKEAITPALLSILEDIVSNYESADLDRMDYVFALNILSKFREKKAFPYILALASLPEKYSEDIFGDMITENLASFIVSTYDDNLDAIKKVIEDPNINQWSRNSAMKSLLGLVAIKKLTREEVNAYVRTLFYTSLIDDYDFSTNLVRVATELYPDDLNLEINQMFTDDRVDRFCIRQEDVLECLLEDKETFLLKNIDKNPFHLPLDNVENAMGWMQVFIPERKSLNLYARTTPKVGRNEFCACGSGKKFKKCCLVR